MLLQPHERVEKSGLAYVRSPHQGQLGEACVWGGDLGLSSPAGNKTKRQVARGMASERNGGGGGLSAPRAWRTCPPCSAAAVPAARCTPGAVYGQRGCRFQIGSKYGVLISTFKEERTVQSYRYHRAAMHESHICFRWLQFGDVPYDPNSLGCLVLTTDKAVTVTFC